MRRAVKLPLLDEFRNFLLTEQVDHQAELLFAGEQIASFLRRPTVKKYEIEVPIPRMPIRYSIQVAFSTAQLGIPRETQVSLNRST